MGAGDVAVDRAPGRSVVARGVDRLVGHRVDRVRPDQLVDVERVRVRRVLRRRRGPERPLHARALRGERLPARSREDPLERLVGDARVGDRRLALQVAAPGLLERGVDLAVDARDEEARDRREAVDRLALGDAPLEPGDVRLGDLLVALDREQQRHVDRDADRGELAERLDARSRARHLDQQVRAIDLGHEVLGGRHRALDLVGELGRQLERDVPVAAAGAIPRVAQQVCAVADVLDREAEEDTARVEPLGGRRAKRLVVEVGVADRLLEDRGVRRDARDAVVDDQALELPGVEQLPRDVVEPDRLAEGLDLVQMVRHVSLLVELRKRPRASTLSRRRRWRSAPESSGARKRWTDSRASPGPDTRSPRQITFASSCSRLWRALNERMAQVSASSSRAAAATASEVMPRCS